MGEYDWDEGVTTDSEKVTNANDYIKIMISLLKIDGNPKNGPMTADMVLGQLRRWIFVGLRTRGDNYNRSTGLVFITPKKPRPISPNAKYWELVVNALELLQKVPVESSHSRRIFFNQAENAMTDFVFAFYEDLKKKDSRKSAKFLADVKNLLLQNYALQQ